MHIETSLYLLRTFSPLAYMFMAGFVVFAIMAAILLLQLRKQKKILEKTVAEKTEALKFSSCNWRRPKLNSPITWHSAKE